MEGFARAPEALSNEQPMDKTWKMWKQEFIIFLRASGIDKKTDEEKAFCLMNQIGKVGLKALQEMQLQSNEETNYDILMEKFDQYYDPPKRETEERFNFFTRSKKSNETIENYVANLKDKAKTCNFDNLTDSLIRDMVILDIKDKHLRKMLIQEKDLDLSKLIVMYKQYELSTEKMKEVTKKVAAEQEGPNNPSCVKKICWRCGISHPIKACPAFKATCEKCNEKGHYTQRCHAKFKGNNTNANNINLMSYAKKTNNITKNPFQQCEKFGKK